MLCYPNKTRTYVTGAKIPCDNQLYYGAIKEKECYLKTTG